MSIVNGRKAKASMQWPSVQGTVVFSEMVMDTSTSSDIATWSPVVTYSYAVNGQALQCSRVKFSPARGKKVVAKYPKGNAVQVFFDPQQPSTGQRARHDSIRYRRCLAFHFGIELRDTGNRLFRKQPNFAGSRIVHPHEDNFRGRAVYRKHASTDLIRRKSRFHRAVWIIAQQADVAF